MGKRLILVLTLALVIGLSFAAYAEVQNVKVSGDILMSAISRLDFNLADTCALLVGNDAKYDVAGIISQVRLRVDADLTDNVSAVVRLINERSWGSDNLNNAATQADDNGDYVAIDLASVTLKEFLYSPVTLTVGRQEIKFGNAMVIGNSWAQNNPWPGQPSSEWQIPWDLSLRKSFDAVRATLDYQPLVIDAIYAKISENDIWWARGLSTPAALTSQERIDIDLYGINTRYDLSALGFKGTGELYYFARSDKTNAGQQVVNAERSQRLKTDTVHTVGVLTKGQIIPKLTASLELAYQFGNSNWAGLAVGPNAGIANAKRQAFAGQFMANYALGGKYSPNLGVGYAIFSGDKNPQNKHDRAWNPMYEDQCLNSIVNALFQQTNVRYASMQGNIKPIGDITLSGVYGFYWLDQRTAQNSPFNWDWIRGTRYGEAGYWPSGTGKILGQALDLTATYDYTEDVQFGLTAGYFFPGNAFRRNSTVGRDYDNTASQLIGSMKVTF